MNNSGPVMGVQQHLMVLKMGYGGKKGPEKGLALGMGLFNKGSLQFLFIMGKVSIFYVNVG